MHSARPSGESGAEPAARLLDVRCRRGRRDVLHDLTLEIERGEVTGVLGPNGAGKSTLLSILIGLRSLTAGRAWVLGEQLPGSSGLRRRIGVVLQETALYDELTTHHNLRFASALYGVPRPEQRIGEVLELLGLSERSRQVVGTLSGGLRRRVAIARALLHRPELLIIDEPTLGVDAEARHAIWSHVRLLRAQGTTVVVASNYLDEVEALCDSAAVLRAGRLLVHEAPSALVARAGRCIDVECDTRAAAAVGELAADMAGVSHIEATPSGASVFVDGGAVPEDIVHLLLQRVRVDGFRIRAADLAEVFRVLEPPGAEAA
jgi:ABC-type multidrug transport system ATPase subunit